MDVPVITRPLAFGRFLVSFIAGSSEGPMMLMLVLMRDQQIWRTLQLTRETDEHEWLVRLGWIRGRFDGQLCVGWGWGDDTPFSLVPSVESESGSWALVWAGLILASIGPRS